MPLRKLEVIVDRLRVLCSKDSTVTDSPKRGKSATANVGIVKSAVDNVNAVKALVEQACASTMYNFSSLPMIHPSRVLGYSCIISYYVKEVYRTCSVYLNLTALADGVKIDFWIDSGDHSYAFVPLTRNDAKQIEALRDFFSGGFVFTEGRHYLLAKAPAE